MAGDDVTISWIMLPSDKYFTGQLIDGTENY